MNGNGDGQTAELIYEFVAIVREEIGLNEDFALRVSQAIVRGLQRRCGGCEIYIPSPDRGMRDAMIRAEFTGGNLKQVMEKYGVGRATIYRALK